MEDQELITLWKDYDKKLDYSLSLNEKNTEDILKIKARSFLMSMTLTKLFTIVVGLVWVSVVNIAVTKLFFVASPAFLFSAALQSVITTVALLIYVYQLFAIFNYDISQPIVAAQKKLAILKSTTLWTARILFLQLPLWSTFYLNQSVLINGNAWWYALQLVVTISLTYLAIWLFFNIKYENRDKKWFKLLFNGQEWVPLMKSIDLLAEIEKYEESNH